jgi:hypothetical protein
MEISDFKTAGDEVVKALTDNPKLAEALSSFISDREKPLLSKRDELLSKNKELSEFLESVGGKDSVANLHRQKTEAEAKAKKALEESTNVDELRSHFAVELKSREDEISKLRNEKKDAKVRSTINRALNEFGGDSKLLGPHIQSRVTADLDGDAVKITVLKEGKPWLVGTEAKPATVKDLLEELKKDPSFAKAFDPKNVTGTGAKGSANGLHGIVNPWAKESLNVTEQGRIAVSNPDLAKALRAAAGINR